MGWVGRKRGDQNESRLQHTGPFCYSGKPALAGAPVRFLGFINRSPEALDGLASLPSSGWLGWSFLNCGPSIALLEQCDSQTHAGPGKRASLGTGWKPAFWRSSAGDSGCTEPQDPSLKPGLGLEALREPWLLPSQAAPQTSQGDWRKVPFATHSSPLLPSIHPDSAEVPREGPINTHLLGFFCQTVEFAASSHSWDQNSPSGFAFSELLRALFPDNRGASGLLSFYMVIPLPLDVLYAVRMQISI